MHTALNDTQLEILKLLHFLKDDKDLQEIKSLLVTYLSAKWFAMQIKHLTKNNTLLKFLKNGNRSIFVNQPELRRMNNYMGSFPPILVNPKYHLTFTR